jgi:hypothetical protein
MWGGVIYDQERMMGIDYIIHYGCDPKQALSVEGLMIRLKSRERAQAIIQLYRDQGDHRPPSEIGFEMVNRLPNGTEKTDIIVVQDLLDLAAELVPWEPHCADCPASRDGQPFGCMSSINYPISTPAESWLLDQLPGNDHPLPFMLFQKAIHELGYTGASVAPLRAQAGVFLEAPEALERNLSDALIVNGDQVFEILFLSGPVQPAHGSLLLQFFGGISRDLDADVMMQLAAPPSSAWISERIPFLHTPDAADDPSIAALKAFFHALHIAYRLQVPVLLDV